MSYTGIYGPLLALDGDHAPRIIDTERYERLCSDGAWGKIVDDQADKGTTATDEYPRREWDTIRGFRTWETDVIKDYNIERVAYYYSAEDFERFWGALGEALEPFQFIHSGESSGWPTVKHYDVDGDDPAGSVGTILRVTVNGEVSVERGAIEFVGFACGDEVGGVGEK